MKELNGAARRGGPNGTANSTLFVSCQEALKKAGSDMQSIAYMAPGTLVHDSANSLFPDVRL